MRFLPHRRFRHSRSGFMVCIPRPKLRHLAGYTLRSPALKNNAVRIGRRAHNVLLPFHIQFMLLYHSRKFVSTIFPNYFLRNFEYFIQLSKKSKHIRGYLSNKPISVSRYRFAKRGLKQHTYQAAYQSIAPGQHAAHSAGSQSGRTENLAPWSSCMLRLCYT